MAAGDTPPSDSDQTAEQAALFAAGALPAGEAATFAARLDTDEAFQAELARLDPVMAGLFQIFPEVAPSPRTRDTLLRQIAPPPGILVQRGHDADWREMGVPGIRLRVLHHDRPRRLVTFLLRLDPGAILPAHPHPEVEECYVLEGDLRTMGLDLRKGDYFRAEASTRHGPTRSKGGCLLLILSAEADHLVDS